MPRASFDIRRYTHPDWKLLGDPYVRVADAVADRCSMPIEYWRDTIPAAEAKISHHRQADQRGVPTVAFEQFFNAWVGLIQRMTAAQERAKEYLEAYGGVQPTLSDSGAAEVVLMDVPFIEGDPSNEVLSRFRPAERYLFDCVVNAYSAIEALFHAIYVVGSLVRPSGFPAVDEAQLHRISPYEAIKRLGNPNGFPTERLTKVASLVLSSADLSLLHDVRNKLIHRGSPIALPGLLRGENGRPLLLLTSSGKDDRPITIDEFTGIAIALGLQRGVSTVTAPLAEFTESRLATGGRTVTTPDGGTSGP
jgi:hypothetical protein